MNSCAESPVRDDVVVRRAAHEGLPIVTGAWVAASFADGDPAELAQSDELVDELLAADELVIVAPVYNFGIPAALKSWIDQVVRAGRTFRFTETGPEGLLTTSRGMDRHRSLVAPRSVANSTSTRPTSARFWDSSASRMSKWWPPSNCNCLARPR